jgi:adenosine 3'-phospho 5'-phosphosulfate transporter B3
MIVGAILTEGVGLRRPPGGTRTVWITAAIGCCVAGSHGFGNTALNYSTYPMKVAFKSCKLVPTMAMGLLVTGKRYSWGEYMAAVVMCVGLFSLTAADAMYKKDDSGKLHYMGPLLLTLGNMFDSVVPNLQEKLLQRVKVRPVDMIFLSNMFVFIIIFCYTQVSGELAIALQFCRKNPTVIAILVAQSACAYCGLRCYLTVIRSHGGVAGVLLANARKICTILLSFILFAKPFNKIHCVGIFLIFLGVYFGVVLKRSGDKQTKMKTPKQDHQHII